MMGIPGFPSFKAITVQARFERLHCWPDAPQEVEFLRQLHRHEFHVEVHIGVESNDRELEFILVKRWLMNGPIYQLANGPGDASLSCEQMAEKLGEKILEKYGHRYVAVTVLEDGENGGTVVWELT